MFDALVSSPHVKVLERALAAAALRHKVISNNIANVNTPGFKRSEVHFEEHLKQALTGKSGLSRTHQRHLAAKSDDLSIEIMAVTNTAFRADGNNVDIDFEMAEMAKNNIYYDAVAQQLYRYFSNLKSVINEGRR
ncbi:flagellar basal body rod protein FlgB [Sporolituus thermophilus]|uniref:Flagellar basal body rod protein FlgB n=1 Tax=Sporolituus thermophilus DSM 23256 TaxID=1123285 RepID=A0A1G7KNS6_9FIRM|nr:flagellar basal body rod protein FlgB [Sporolituus thermophilus]SDF38776.1 flagellar basal-body rod protein FlgB [Sporolituus thermophilus DSM 23256]